MPVLGPLDMVMNKTEKVQAYRAHFLRKYLSGLINM